MRCIFCEQALAYLLLFLREAGSPWIRAFSSEDYGGDTKETANLCLFIYGFFGVFLRLTTRFGFWGYYPLPRSFKRRKG
jgi:hypothetical protein